MQSNTERAPKGIEMSPRGKREWQDALRDCTFETSDRLLDALAAIEISPPTVKKAFNGEKIAHGTWEKIFTALDLQRETFFTDAEWYAWNPEKLWQNLWALAEDGDDRFGLVLPQRMQDSGLGTGTVGKSRYEKTLPIGKPVLLEIPAGLTGYLILVERDAAGSVELISPSCLVVDPELKGVERLLPQYPPSEYKFFIPSTPGINSFWAGIFTKLPDWDWLVGAREGVSILQSEQLIDLWNYAKQPPQGSRIWRSSYVVVG